MSKINSGDVVRVHYEGRLEDGTVFDTSAEREPLEFEAGSDQLIPGFSAAVVGMETGERKTVTLPPSEAYGEPQPEMMQRVQVSNLPDGAKVGDQLMAHAGERQIPVTVREMAGDEAVLDANHPLAGKTLVFDIEIVEVNPA